ncbi:uncharacterized protein LOC125832518 [Solanum verrucosum]|uniref:uncharacterized protein LOC125832518 n=1 Tax=Solanum verrucosum TaxID=315347 RepID=UPI0020D10045|nr:uncharacterized protein LOC125832518 [Solanum verrucosum]
MVSLSFSSFMFVMLLFIFLTIKDTIVHTDDQAKQIVHEAEIDNIRDLRSHLSVKKEVLDGVPAAAEFSNVKMGGRKMMIEKKEDMKEVKKAESSGNYDRHLGHDSRKNVHHQDNERDSMNSASTDNSKNDDQSDDNGSFENLESENFQDDATEFFTMKDYVGRPRRKPGHKTPINNSQPLHTSNP